METRLLRYFIAVANYGTISEAAKHLFISQPTLSRQMKDLEEKLQTKLFIRENRNIVLTEQGKYLFAKAQEIIDLVDKTRLNINEQSQQVMGEIHIGGGETRAIQLIAERLKKLLDKYPSIKVHLYSGNADEIGEKLDNGLLDFGIFIEPTDKGKYDYITLPAIDTWGVLMRKDSPLARDKYILPKDIIGLPLLISRQSLVDDKFSGWLGVDIKELNVIGTYNLLFNASVFVKEKLGYAICLDGIINVDGESDLCFRPLYPNMTASLNIVWKKHQPFSVASRKFLEELRKNLEDFNH